jgi:chitin disaccharide deacetylase
MAALIFNADDLGLSPGVNKGIVDCYKNGVVNSASLMTTTKYFEEAVALIKEHNLSNIGLHFNLTEGKPLLQKHKTIIDVEGNFIRSICDKKNIDITEIEQELETQYKMAIDAGVLITHFDSHHHVHMSALLNLAFLKLANKYDKPLRKVSNTYRHPLRRLKHYLRFKNHQFYTSSFSAEFYDKKATFNVLKSIINNSRGSIEIMCHPGYQDNENGVYNIQRQQEMKVLLNSDLNKVIK